MQVAIFPSPGIGDGLIFLIAAYNLEKIGYKVSIYHDALLEVKELFPLYHFYPLKKGCSSSLDHFDKIICQYDHCENKKFLLFSNHPKLSIFYPTYNPHKQNKLSSFDVVFNPLLPMAKNLQIACNKLFNIKSSKETGINICIKNYRKHLKRVAIHPTSTDLKKNWSKKNYLQLASLLKKKGFTPVFLVSPKERPYWEDILFFLPFFPNLKDTALYIHESGYFIGNDSGLGHLASLLKIPTLTLANNKKRLKLWKPDFSKGKIMTPPTFIPNVKGFRLREKHWSLFISPRKVLKTFCKNIKK